MLGRPAVNRSRIVSWAGEPAGPFELGGGGNLTPPTTAHVWSPWREYIAATPEDWDGFDLHASFYSAAEETNGMIQIGVGASGSETVCFGPMIFGTPRSYGSYDGNAFIPYFIPRGTRIAARFQVAVAWPVGEYPGVGLLILGRQLTEVQQSLGQYAVYGANPAATEATLVAGFNYADWGYYEMVAATPFRVRRILFNMSSNTAFARSLGLTFSVGIGPAASEVEIVQGWSSTGGSCWPEFAVDIPEGSRIAIRENHNSSGGGAGRFIVHLFG